MAKRSIAEILKAVDDPTHEYSCHGCIHLRTVTRANIAANPEQYKTTNPHWNCAKRDEQRGMIGPLSTAHPVAWDDTCKDKR